MRDRREDEKLAELRAKTDRELIALIDSAIARARRFANVRPREAERAHAEAQSLLPAVSSAERPRLQDELARVGDLLYSRTCAAC